MANLIRWTQVREEGSGAEGEVMQGGEDEVVQVLKTSIQISPETRDRLYYLKFRRTYDQFINELCDLYEEHNPKK